MQISKYTSFGILDCIFLVSGWPLLVCKIISRITISVRGKTIIVVKTKIRQDPLINTLLLHNDTVPGVACFSGVFQCVYTHTAVYTRTCVHVCVHMTHTHVLRTIS